MDPAAVLSHLVERAARGELVVFVGAGVSKEAGLPLWHELFEPLRIRIRAAALAHPVDVAHAYAELHGREALLDFVEGALAGDRAPGRLHRTLSRVPARLYFTTNYDHLLERALAEIGPAPLVLRHDDDTPTSDLHGPPTVVKLHGCLGSRASLVITRGDYDAYQLTHPRFTHLLQSHLARHTFLFVGFSLTDLNFREIHEATYRSAGRAGLDAYALDAGAHAQERAASWRNLGVEVLRFTDFLRQREFVEELAARTDSAALPRFGSRLTSSSAYPASVREPATLAPGWHGK